MRVGRQCVTQRRTITEADVVSFAGLTGDFNPLHVDEIFAAAGPFGRRVVHGLLVLSVATGLRQQRGVFYGVVAPSPTSGHGCSRAPSPSGTRSPQSRRWSAPV